LSSYLAFDLGAESGRLMLGRLESGRLELTEVHRFPNRMVNIGGGLHWDVPALFREMKLGLHLCAEKHTRTPASIGIDTWGVDFALLDEQGELVDLPFTYRDVRTRGAIEDFTRLISRERLYELTGIQIISINTLLQLYSMVRDSSPHLARARHLLFMPDLFNWFLTGKQQTEFTFATTSQLLNPRTREWEPEILEALGIPRSVLPDVRMPGTDIGPLLASVRAETGLESTPVRAVGSHDTASAVAAIPASDSSFAYISSGTWSLMGFESREPVITALAQKYNFSNEGAVDGGFRVLKNITGLWLLQECRRCWSREGQTLSYDELVRLAEQAEPFRTVLDPDNPRFVDPDDMPRAIAEYCRAGGEPVPENTGQLVRCILESLALAYRHTLSQIKEIRVAPVERIHVIGGGSQNDLLCRMTADATGLPVYAGPKEATAIGNIMVQAMAARDCPPEFACAIEGAENPGVVPRFSDLRRVVRESFPPKLYAPQVDPRWDSAFERFRKLKARQHE
jgi:rhamnulokinase